MPEFTAAVALSSARAWAFSSTEDGAPQPAAWQLTGSAWTQVAFPGRRGEQVLTADASSPTNVWAFTSVGRAIRWNGCSWAVVRGLPVRRVSDAAVISRNDIWVFGGRSASGEGQPTTWHYDGRTWTRSRQAAGLAAASVVSARDIWAYGADLTSDATVIAHWDGSAWERSSVAALLPRPRKYCLPGLDGIYAVSSGDAWAVGSDICQDVAGPSVLLHYSSGAWRRVANLGPHIPVGIMPDGRGGLWLPMDGAQTLDGLILRYSHGQVTSSPLPVPPGQLFLFHAASTPGGSAAFAVGRRTQPGGATEAITLRYHR